MTDAKSTAKKITRWVNLVLWSAIGFFLIGYLPAAHLQPSVAITVTVAVSAMAVIPYASRLARPMRSAIVAGVLGAISGVAMVAVLTAGTMSSSQALTDFAVRHVCAVGGFCAGVGALFGHLARQRRRQAEEEWKKHG